MKKVSSLLLAACFVCFLAHCTSRTDIGPTPVSASRIEVAPVTLPADGVTGATVTVRLRDGAGKPQQGLSVTLVSEGIDVVFQQPTEPTDGQGVTYGTVRGLETGLARIGARVEIDGVAVPLSQVASLHFVAPQVPLVGKLVVSVLPARGSVDEASSREVVVQLSHPDASQTVHQQIELASSRTSDVLTPSSGLTDEKGSFSATLVGTVAGDSVVSAVWKEASGALASHATAASTLLPGAPDAAHSVVTCGDQGVAISDGNSINEVIVVVRDQYNNVVPQAPVTMTASLGNCQLVPPAGMTGPDGSFRAVLRSVGLGTGQLVAGLSSGAAAGNVVFVVGPASVSTSFIEKYPQDSLAADGLSAFNVAVTFADASGQPRAFEPLNWHLPAGVSLQGAQQTDALGQALGLVTSTRAGVMDIEVQSSTLAQSVSLTFAAGPPSVTASVLTLSPSSVIAGQTSQLTLTLTDLFANPIANQIISLTGSQAGIKFSPTQLLTNASGMVTASITATVARPTSILASWGASSLSQILLVSPSSPSHATSTLRFASSTVLADGNHPLVASLFLADSYGNPVGGAALSQRVSGVGFVPDANGTTTDSSGRAQIRIFGTQPGVTRLDVTSGAMTLSANGTFVVGPPAASTSTLTVTPNSLVADGRTTTFISCRIADAQGHPLANQRVNLLSSQPSDQWVQLASQTDDNGVLSATLVGTRAGARSITATVGSVSLSAPLLLQAGPADANQSTFSASSNTWSADNNASVMLVASLRDALGNPVPSLPVCMVVKSGRPLAFANNASSFNAISDAQGFASSLVTTSLSGPRTVGLSAGNVSLSLGVTALPGPPAPQSSTLTLSPNTLIAGGPPTTITVVAKDAFGNPVADVRIQVVASPGRVAGQSSGASDANGIFATSLGATLAGQSNVMVVLNANTSQSTTLYAPLSVVAGAPDAHLSSLFLAPQVAVADGAAVITATLTLLDAFSNPIAGVTPSFTGSGSGVSIVPLGSATAPNGQITATLASTQAGPVVLQSDAGISLRAQGTFIAGAPATTTSSWLLSASEVIADGNTEVSALLTVRDAQGNPTPHVQVTLGSNPTGLLWRASTSQTDTDGRFYAFARSQNVAAFAATAQIQNFVLSAPLAALPGPPSAQMSSLSVSPATLSADGLSTAQAWLRLADVLGHPLPNTSVQWTAPGLTPAVASALTDASGGALLSLASTGPTNTFVTATSGAVSLSVPVTSVVGSPNSQTSNFNASTLVQVANGSSPVQLTLVLRDALGHLASSVPVAFSATDSNASLSVVSGRTDGSGRLTTSLTCADEGNLTINAQSTAADGSLLNLNRTIAFVPVGGNNTFVNATASPNTLVAGASVANIVIFVSDAANTPVRGVVVAVAGAGPRDTLVIQGQPADSQGLVTGVTDANGMVTGTFLSTLAQTLDLSASIDAGAIGDGMALSVLPAQGNGVLSTFVASPNAFVADGSSQSAITVHLRDGFGNPMPNTAATLSVTQGQGALGSSALTTDAFGNASTFVTSLVAGPLQLSVISGPVALTANLITQAGPPQAAQSSLIISPNVVLADGQAVAQLQVMGRDAVGNPTPNVPLVFSISGGNTATLNGLITPAWLDGQGRLTQTFSSTRAQTQALQARFGGVALTANYVFVAGVPSAAQSRVSVSALSALADGNATIAVIGQWADAFGNPTPNQNVTVNWGAYPLMVSPSAGSSDTQGQFTSTLRTTMAGNVLVTLTSGGAQLSQPVQFVAGLPSSLTSQLALAPNVAVANGQDALVATLLLTDAYFNPVVGYPCYFSAPASSTLDRVFATSDASGQATTKLRSTTAGPISLVASFAGQTLSVSGLMKAGLPSSSTSSLTFAPPQIIADGVSQASVSVVLRDAFGNPTPNQGVSFVDGGHNDLLQLNASSTDATGTVQATLVSTVAELKNVSVTSGNVALLAALPFVAGSASSSSSALMAQPNTTVADGQTPITLTLVARDAQGNPTPQRAVTVSLSGLGTQIGLASGSTDSQGRFSTTLTSTLAQLKTATVVVDSAALSLPVVFTPGLPDPSQSSFAVTPATITADGQSLGSMALNVADAQGNPIPSQTVTFSVLGSENGVGALPATTDARGYWTASLSSTRAETKILSAMIQNVTILGRAQFVAGAVDATHSTLVVRPSAVTADGQSQAIAFLSLTDSHNNVIAASPVTWLVPGATLGQSSGVTDTNGLLSTTLTARQAGMKVVTASSQQTSISAPAVFVAGQPDANKTTLVATPSETVADGQSSVLIFLALKDSSSNPISNQNVRWTTSGQRDSLSANTTVTAVDGTSQVTLTSLRAQRDAIVVSTGGMAKAVFVTFDPGAASTQQSALAVSPNVQVANGQSPMQIVMTVADAQGNPVANQAANIIIDGTNNILSQTRVQTDANGLATLTLASSTAQVKNIVAQLQNFTLSTQGFFIAGPPVEAQSSVLVSPNTVTADGIAQATVTLRSADAFGNPTPGQPVSLTLSGSASSLTLTQGMTNARGQLSAAASSTRAQVQNVTVSVGGITLYAPIKFVAGAVSVANSSLTYSPNHVLADGQSQAVVALQVADAQNNPVIAQPATFSSSQGTQDFSGPQIVSTDSLGRAQTTLISTQAGARQITATIGGTSFTLPMTFYPGPPDAAHSLWLASPNVLVADGQASSVLALTVADAFGNPVSGQQVALQVSGAGASFGALGSQTDSSGQFYATLLATKAEAKVVTAAFGGTSLNTNVLFLPGAPSSSTSSVMATPNQVVADNISSVAVAVTLRDSQGNPVPNRAVSFTISGQGATLNPSSGITDAAGTLIVTLTGVRAEQKTVVAATSGMSVATLVQFVAGAPSNQTTTLLDTPGVISADLAAVYATAPVVSLQVNDAQGNPVPNQNVTLFSSVVGDTVTPSFAQTDPNGQLLAKLVGQSAGVRTVTAQLAQLSTTAQLTLLAGAPNAALSKLSLLPNTIVANGSSQATISASLVDSFGNPTPGIGVLFVTPSPSVMLAQNAIVTDTSGTAQTLITTTVAQTANVAFQANGVVLGQILTAIPGPASNANSTLLLSPNALVVDGSTSTQVKISLADAYGNVLPNHAVSLGASGLSNVFGITHGQTDSSGIFTTSFRSNQSGMKTVTAAVDTTTISRDINLLPGSPNALTSSLTINPNMAVANGISQLPVLVQFLDMFGNPVPNVAVSLSASDPLAVITAAAAATDSTGTVTASVTSTHAAPFNLTATGGNLNLVAPATFVAGPASASNMTLTAAPAAVLADGNSAVTLSLRAGDVFGNPVGGSATMSSAGPMTLVPTTVALDGNGFAQVQASSSAVGSFAVTAAINSAQTSQTITFFPGPPAALTSSLTLSPNTDIVADGNMASAVLLIVRDIFGHPLANQSVSFSSLPNSTVMLSSPSGMTSASGQLRTTITSQTMGVKNISASVGNVTLSANLVFIAGSPNASRSSLVATPNNNIVADGQKTSLITLSLADAYGNPVAQQNVTWSASANALLLSSTLGQTDANGVATTSTTSTVAKVFVVNAAAGPATLSAPVGFVAGSPNAQLSSLILTPNSALADGNHPMGLVVILRDAFGNPVPQIGVNFSSTDPLDVFSLGSGLSDANGAIKTFVTSTHAGSPSLNANFSNLQLTSTARFASGAASSANMQLLISPNAVLADGVSAAGITLFAADSFGNPAGGNVVFASAGNGVILTPTGVVLDANGQARGQATGSQVVSSSISATVGAATAFAPVSFFAGPPAQSTSSLVLTPNTSVVANGSAQITAVVTIADAFGHPLANQNVMMTFNPNSGISSVLGASTNTSGQAFFAATSTVAGTKLVSATTANVALLANVVFVAGSPNATRSSLTATPNMNLVANAQNVSVLWFYVMDAFGNPVTQQNVTWSAVPNSVLLSASQSVTDGSGTASISARTAVAGNVVLTATAGPAVLTVPISFVPGSPNSITSTLVLTPNSVVADGVQSMQLVLSVRDATGNPVPAISATMGSTDAATSFNPNMALSNANGVVSATLTSKQASLPTISASLANFVLTTQANFRVGNPNALRSTLVVNPNGGVTADGVSYAWITAQLADATANAVGGQNITWSNSGNAIIMANVVTQTDGNGFASLIAKTTLAQTANLTLQAGNVLTLTAPLNFVSGTPNSVLSSLVLSSPSATVGGNIAVSVQLRDAFGNKVTQQNTIVNFSCSGNQLLCPSPATADLNGLVKTSLWVSTLPGTYALQASSANAILSSNFVALIGPPSLQYSYIVPTGSPNQLADGNHPVAFSGHLADQYNNTITGANVTLSAASPAWISARYANGSAGASQVAVTINNGASSLYSFGQTTGWPDWHNSSWSPIALPQGNVIFTYAAPNQAVSTNFDSIYVSPSSSSYLVQAETGTLIGTSQVANTQVNYTGSGYVSAFNLGSGVSVPVIGTPGDLNKTLSIRYSTVTTGQRVNLVVNGNAQQLALAATANLNVFTNSYETPVVLLVGNNIVQITAAVAATTLIDALQVTEIPTSTQIIQAESGLVGAPANVGTVWVGYQGTGYVDFGSFTNGYFSTNLINNFSSMNSNTLTNDANGNFSSSVVSSRSGPIFVSAKSGNFVVSQNFNFVSGPPSSSNAVLYAANSVAAGGAMPVVVLVQDSFNNPVLNSSVSFSSSANTVTLTPNAVITDFRGRAATSLQAPTVPTATQICAYSGNALLVCGNVNIVPGPPSPNYSSMSVSMTQNIVADGNSILSISGHLADQYNNLIPPQTATLSASGIRWLSFRTANGGAQLSTMYGFLKNTVVGTWPAPANGGWSTWVSSPWVPIPLISGTNALTITQQNSFVSTANVDSFYVSPSNTFNVLQAENFSLQGTAQTASSNPNYTGSGYVSAPSNAAVTFSVFGIPGDLNQSLSIRYSAFSTVSSGLSINGVAYPNNNFLSSGNSSGTSGIWLQSQEIPITLMPGNNIIRLSTLSNPAYFHIDSVQLTDLPTSAGLYQAENGNLVSPAVIRSSWANYQGTGYVEWSGSYNAAFSYGIQGASDVFSNATPTIDANGNFSSTLVSTRAEQKTLTVYAQGGSFSQNVVFVPGPVSTAGTVMTLASTSAAAGSNIVVGVLVQDANSNPIASQAVNFTTPLAGASLSANQVVSDARGQVTTTLFLPSNLTSSSICVASGSTLSSCANFTIVAAPASQSNSTLTVSPNTFVAGSYLSERVSLADAYGNPGAGQALLGQLMLNNNYVFGPNVTFTADSNGVLIPSLPALTQAGVYQTTFTSGSAILQANFTVSPNQPYRAALVAWREVPAGVKNDLNITILDIYGNLTPSYAGQVNVTLDDSLATTPQHTFVTSDKGFFTVFGGLVGFNAGIRTLTANGNGLVSSANTFVIDPPIVGHVKLKTLGASPNTCLAAQGSDVQIGQNVVIAPCSGHISQLFATGSDNSLRVANRCLTLLSPYQPGASIGLQTCVLGSSQQWQVTGSRVVSLGNSNACLGIVSQGNNPLVGAVACSGGNADIFASASHGGWMTLQTDIGLSMVPSAGSVGLSGVDFNRLVLGDTASNFAVLLNSNDQLAVSGNLCLDVQGQNAVSGANVTYYSCQNTNSQKWQFSGNSLISLGSPNLCVTRSGNLPGTLFTLQACSGASSQTLVPAEFGHFGSMVATNSANQQVCLGLSSVPTPNTTNFVVATSCQRTANQTVSMQPWPYASTANTTASALIFPSSSSALYTLDGGALAGNISFASALNATFFGQKILQNAVLTSPGQFYLSQWGTGLVLDANALNANGQMSFTAASAGRATQRWYYDGGTVSWSPQANANMCFFVADNANSGLGQPLGLGTCASSNTQQFVVPRVQSAASSSLSSTIVYRGLCVDANGLAGSGVPSLNVCQGVPSQMWSVPLMGGALVSGASSCMDSNAPAASSGLAITACSGAQTQNFTLILK